jgi:hypothetical protein
METLSGGHKALPYILLVRSSGSELLERLSGIPLILVSIWKMSPESKEIGRGNGGAKMHALKTRIILRKL